MVIKALCHLGKKLLPIKEKKKELSAKQRFFLLSTQGTLHNQEKNKQQPVFAVTIVFQSS
jgi:hypothetical protein